MPSVSLSLVVFVEAFDPISFPSFPNCLLNSAPTERRQAKLYTSLFRRRFDFLYRSHGYGFLRFKLTEHSENAERANIAAICLCYVDYSHFVFLLLFVVNDSVNERPIRRLAALFVSFQSVVVPFDCSVRINSRVRAWFTQLQAFPIHHAGLPPFPDSPCNKKLDFVFLFCLLSCNPNSLDNCFVVRHVVPLFVGE
jgi:hypothetical protein